MLPASGVILSLAAPAEAKLPTPPERVPEDGTFAGFAGFKAAPKAGVYTISLSAGAWIDVVQDGHFLKPKGFSGAKGHSQVHQIRAFGETLCAAGLVSRQDSISIAILPLGE